jgi:hypothetical protein
MKSTVKIHCLIGFLAVPFSAVAAPAVRLILTNDECLFQFCPPTHPPPATTVASGSAFQIFVIAVDSAGLLDPSYEGTVTFASTDSLAGLPPGYTFVPTDQGRKGFIAILRTAGSQMITVSDSAGNLIPGTLVITVTGPTPGESVPMISAGGKILLLLALASAGALLARLGG